MHRAISAGSPSGHLTEYLCRAHDERIRAVLRDTDRNHLVVLVGESSTGKTRAAYEAVRVCASDWPLIFPLDVTELTALADERPDRGVVWLDEAARYLDSADCAVAVTAIRRLLRGQQTTIVIGTMWLDDWRRFTRQPTRDEVDVFRDVRGLLTDTALRVDVPPVVNAAEMTRNTAHCRDERWRLATDTARDGRVIQVLAGGDELADRYDHPTNPYAHALVSCAMDVRRVGYASLIPDQLLRFGAVDNLSNEARALDRSDADWFAHGMREARRAFRGVAALRPERLRPGMGLPDGYMLHDYLDQHGRAVRARTPVPASTWQALVRYTSASADLLRVLRSAHDRGQYRIAIQLFETAARQDDITASMDFMLDFLLSTGRIDRAERILRAGVAAGNWLSVVQLVQLLSRQGRDDEICAAVEASVAAGHPPRDNGWSWPGHIAALLSGNHRGAIVGNYVPVRSKEHINDHDMAVAHAVELLDDLGDEAEAERLLWERFAAGEPLLPFGLLMYRLTAQRRADEAAQLLRTASFRGHLVAIEMSLAAVDDALNGPDSERALRTELARGNPFAFGDLATVLHRQGCTDELAEVLREHCAAGNPFALRIALDQGVMDRSVGLEALTRLAIEGDLNAVVQLGLIESGEDWLTPVETILRRNAITGTPNGVEKLAGFLTSAGRDDEARRVWRHGLEPDGGTAHPW